MKIMKRNIFTRIFVLIALSYSIALGQTAGNTGLSFLKIGASAKSIAASDIGFLNSDAASVYYNPASVNLQKSASVMFTHQMWIQDLTSEIVNANFTFWGLPIAVGVNTTKIKGFEIRTKPSSEPDGTFNVNYFYGNLSTGFTLVENLEFGVTIKYLYESLLSDDASGTGYDFGLIYTNLVENLNVGASVRNLGSMNALRTEKTKLPSDFIINSTYNIELENSSLELMPVIGVQKYLDVDNLHIHVGSEIVYDKQFALRVGYVTAYEAKGISAGAGFYWNGFNIDYAFTPFSYGIGNANTFSLVYTF